MTGPSEGDLEEMALEHALFPWLDDPPDEGYQCEEPFWFDDEIEDDEGDDG